MGWTYDRVVLRRREVRQAERVPEHNVRVVQAGGGVRGDPGREALGGLAGGLGHVAARRVDLVVVVYVRTHDGQLGEGQVWVYRVGVVWAYIS